MRLSILLPLIVVLAMSACYKVAETGAKDSSAGAKALSAAEDFRMQPGLYQTKIELKQLSGPNLPPQVLAMLKQRMVEKPITYCLTPADAAKGLEAMKAQMGKGNCQFDKFSAVAGKLDTSFTCDMGGKGSMRVTSQGTYTDTGSVSTSSSDVTMGGSGAMHLEQVNTTTRIGECTK